MHTFLQFITETLGAPVSWTWENDVSPGQIGYQRYRAFFRVKENDYRMTMSLRFMNRWDVTFALLRETWRSKDTNDGDTTDKVPYFGVMSTGSAFTVFGTIVAILKDFTKKQKPMSLHFDAMAEPSRIKLYQRLVQMVPQIDPHYHAVRDEYLPSSRRLRPLPDDEFLIARKAG